MAPANKTNQPKAGETATAKLLFIDHESSYNVGCFFQNRRYEVSILKILKHKQIISTAWNWLGEEKIDALALPMLPSYRRNPDTNRGLVKKIHALYEEADIIVGHNIDGFDDKMSNTDIVKSGLLPPPPHKTIDTLRIARDKFCFPGNRLDDLGEYLGLGKKIRHDGFEMWEKCMNGDPKAWKDMVRYNIGDVALLKKIYFKFRPWITKHPAMKVRGEFACPSCGSAKLESRGFNLNRTGRVPRYQCRDCGTWASGILAKKKWVVR